MKGTEKQVTWAEDIKANVLKVFEDVKPLAAKEPKAIERINAMAAALESAEYAGDVINLFKGFHPSGNTMKDFAWIASTYKMTCPMSEGEKKILMK